MSTKGLDLVRGLSVNDRWGLFIDVSLTLFRAESLISIVVVGQDDVMGSSKPLKERNEMKERCKGHKQNYFDAEKELLSFERMLMLALRSLKEEVYRYVQPSLLGAWIEKLKDFLNDKNKCSENENDSTDVEEACQANSLRSLE